MANAFFQNDSQCWIPLPAGARALAAESENSVLLETSRFDSSNAHSYLFLNPVNIISGNRVNEVPRIFSEIEEALTKGFYVAGYFAYECGYSFEKIGAPNFEPNHLPIAWFGVFEKPIVFDHAKGIFEGLGPTAVRESNFQPDPAPVVDSVSLRIDKERYCTKILEIKNYIERGETYQINFTDEVIFSSTKSACELYTSLLKRQSVAYGALMNVAAQQILSFSPELLFRIDNRQIVTRPMKGTMPRGLDSLEDAEAALRLQHDEKNRSEHVMIVDLLRNDLGRICVTGSVRVEDLFSIERYETLLQMTSTVSGTLRSEVSYYDIFRSIFPSGSVTGAPKIRAMQIIRELEEKPRGVYTGAIGFFSPGGSSVFNVAIRTLVLKDGQASMGVGGGIVADSDPTDEYRECLLKSAFLTRPAHDFQLIETILWQGEFRLLPMHMDRLEASASYFNFFFDRAAVLEKLHEVQGTLEANAAYKVRLLLHSSGTLTINTSEHDVNFSFDRVALSAVTTSSKDVFVRHKTTNRNVYDQRYAEARRSGFDEVIFMNEKGEATEGAISNIFIERAGKLITPLLSCGVLPGIFRRYLLETRTNAEEAVLTLDDLKRADAVFLCNSLRGLNKIKSLCLDISIPV